MGSRSADIYVPYRVSFNPIQIPRAYINPLAGEMVVNEAGGLMLWGGFLAVPVIGLGLLSSPMVAIGVVGGFGLANALDRWQDDRMLLECFYRAATEGEFNVNYPRAAPDPFP